MAHAIHTTMTASITELKRNPHATVEAGEGAAVAILNRNQPAFYCVPAALYEELMERLDDADLNALADAREGMGETAVSLNDL